jgi:hypothetical protein
MTLADLDAQLAALPPSPDTRAAEALQDRRAALERGRAFLIQTEREIAALDAQIAWLDRDVQHLTAIRADLAEAFAQAPSPMGGTRDAMAHWDNLRMALQAIDYGIDFSMTALPINFILDQRLRACGYAQGIAQFPGSLPELQQRLDVVTKRRADRQTLLNGTLRSLA